MAPEYDILERLGYVDPDSTQVGFEPPVYDILERLGLAEPDQVERGAFEQFGAGVASGVGGILESGGGAAQFVGETVGLEGLGDLGESLSE